MYMRMPSKKKCDVNNGPPTPPSLPFCLSKKKMRREWKHVSVPNKERQKLFNFGSFSLVWANKSLSQSLQTVNSSQTKFLSWAEILHAGLKPIKN